MPKNASWGMPSVSEETFARDDWREKYYASLERLETLEAEWQRVEQVLRQAIARLALAADVPGSPLSGELRTLRTAIRKGRRSAELEELIETLSARILELDEQAGGPAPPTAPELLARLLEGVPLPRSLRRAAAALKKRLAKAPAEADPAPLVDEVVELLTEALGADPNEPSGFLGRLRGGRGQAGTSANGVDLARDILRRVVSALADVGRLQLEQELLSRRVEEAIGADGMLEVTDDVAALLVEALRVPAEPAVAPGGDDRAGEGLAIHELLIRLLERLEVPAELAGYVDTLKASLNEGLAPDEVEPTLMSIAELVAKMRSRVQSEKQELESFLQQLTVHLQELDGRLQGAMETRRASFREGRELDEAVQSQVRGIEKSVHDASDLASLKSSVKESLEAISHHLEVFRTAEAERGERAEQEAKELAARLNELEAEAEGLRDRVVREHHQALYDSLTGIYNRLAYDERVAQEYARWKRYATPLTLLIWDVDRFKVINDTYGHQAGDKVLRVIAKLLDSNVRETDFVARYGGEEFVVLLPETDLAGARAVAEKLRTKIEQTEFHYRNQPVRITISGGLAQFQAGDEVEAVFARADTALYQAKDTGRNRCCTEEDAGDAKRNT
jgi:diguanylate cyclase